MPVPRRAGRGARGASLRLAVGHRAVEGPWLRIFARLPSAVAAKTALALLQHAGSACRAFAQSAAAGPPGSAAVAWGWGDAGVPGLEKQLLALHLALARDPLTAPAPPCPPSAAPAPTRAGA